MIRTFCDCCGAEIKDRNAVSDRTGERLLATLRNKLNPAAEPLQVEVITAQGSSWNSGQFCKYCVIDAINQADDRPRADTVPRHQLQQAETRYVNLLLDLSRLVNGEEPLNGFSEVEQLRQMLAGTAGVTGRKS